MRQQGESWTAFLRRVRELYRTEGILPALRTTTAAIVHAFKKKIGMALLHPIVVLRTLNREDLKQRTELSISRWTVEPDDGETPTYEDRIPFGLDPGSRFHMDKAPIFRFSDNVVHTVDNVTLIKPFGIGLTRTGRIIADTAAQQSRSARYLTDTLRQSLVQHPANLRYLAGHTVEADVELACSLQFLQERYYYHWVIEQLLKLRGVELFREETGRQPTLIIPADAPPVVQESLDVLGYDDANILEWAGGAIQVEELVVPSFPEPSASNLRWLRQRAVNGIDRDHYADAYSEERIYISRENAGYRHVANEDEVTDYLSDHGFTTYHMEDISFQEQVALCSNAEAIIGCHGSGLTSIVWAENALLVELFNHHVVPVYAMISAIKGCDYEPLRCDAISPHDWNSNMVVDIQDLEEILGKHGLKT